MNNRIDFDKIPEEYRKNYIGSGDNGNCYLISNNEVFKTFFYPEIFEKRVIELTKMNNPYFIFPKKIVYVKNKFVGYIMDYVDGVTLDKMKNIDIFKYIEDIKNIEYYIAVLSRRGYFLMDFKNANIMIDKNNNIKIIDTDYFLKTDNTDKLYNTNIHDFAFAILRPFVNIYRDSFKSRELEYKRRLLIDGKYLPSKFLIDILKEYRLILLNEVNNTSDMKESMRLLLK